MAASNQSNPRNTGYDLLKMISIYLVIIIHFVPMCYDAGAVWLLPKVSVLASGATTTFYMINGFFLFSRQLDIKKHYRKCLDLFITLLLWRGIIYLAFFLLDRETYSLTTPRFISYILGEDINGMVMGYSWFMFSLIAIYTVFPILKICYDHPSGKKCIAILIIIMLAVTSFAGSLDLNSIDGLSMGGLYRFNVFGEQGRWVVSFMFGGFVNDIIAWFKRKTNTAVLLVSSSILFIFAWFAQYMVLRMQGNLVGYMGFSLNDSNRLYSSVFIGSALLCVIFSQISIHIPGITKLIELSGKNTLGIYYMHIIFVFLIYKYYGANMVPYPIFGLIVPFIILLICLVITLTLKKIPIINRLF